MPLGFLQHRAQGLFEKSGVVGEAHYSHHRTLPGILPFQFRHGHIEFPPQPVLQAAEHLPLVFKRVRLGDINFQGEQTDRHLHPCKHMRKMPRSSSREKNQAVASASTSFCMWKHSSTSATLMSL